MRLLSTSGNRRTGLFRSCFVVAVAVVTLHLPAAANPAQAQGLFQSLFGSKPKRAVRQQQYRQIRRGNSDQALGRRGARTSYPLRRYRISRPPRSLYKSFDRDAPRSRNRHVQRHSRGNYRTVCVRSCDGFYFPISYGVSRGRFGRDAGICRSKCGDGAKLYYTTRKTALKKMVDLRGKQYTKTKNAFLFRKERIKGCTCKPQPWAISELSRHQMYALNEPHERTLARLDGDVAYLAGITKKRTRLVFTKPGSGRAAAITTLANAGSYTLMMSTAFQLPVVVVAVQSAGETRIGESANIVVGDAVDAANHGDETLSDERDAQSMVAARQSSTRRGRNRAARRRFARMAARNARRTRARPRDNHRRRGRERRHRPAKSTGFNLFGGKPKHRWPGD